MSVAGRFSGGKTTQLAWYHVPSGKKRMSEHHSSPDAATGQSLFPSSSAPFKTSGQSKSLHKGCRPLHASPLLSSRN